MKFFLPLLVALLLNDFAAADTICAGSSKKPALVVIDMQPYFVTRGGNDQTPENMAKTDQVINEQIAAIKRARAAEVPIVFIEYEAYGDTNPTLREAVGNYGEVRYFKKTTDGMFDVDNLHRQELADYLAKRNVGTLVITGANGGACVLGSIKGSLAGNCSVVAYNKGIADFNYKEFIYPYVNHYTDIKPDCGDCTFKEVSSIDVVANALVDNSGDARMKMVDPTAGVH